MTELYGCGSTEVEQNVFFRNIRGATITTGMTRNRLKPCVYSLTTNFSSENVIVARIRKVST